MTHSLKCKISDSLIVDLFSALWLLRMQYGAKMSTIRVSNIVFKILLTKYRQEKGATTLYGYRSFYEVQFQLIPTIFQNCTRKNFVHFFGFKFEFPKFMIIARRIFELHKSRFTRNPIFRSRKRNHHIITRINPVIVSCFNFDAINTPF